MPASNIPHDEEARLRALHDYAVLDTPAESAFDESVALAARICSTPISLITLVDRERQWTKAQHGLTQAETPRAVSFCAHAICQADELLVVPDATRDARFADNPFVTGETGIRFYAGVPLRTSDGHAVGTLCVIDRQPRELTADQLEALRMLGRQVVTQLELRRSLKDAALKQQRLENSQRIAGLGDWEYDFIRGRFFWSHGIYSLLGLDPGNPPANAESFYRSVHPEDAERVRREKLAPDHRSHRVNFIHRIVRPDGEARHVRHIAEMLFNALGVPTRESGTLQDITVHIRAAALLQASEIRHRRLFEAAKDGVLVLDAETGLIDDVNPFLEQLLGAARGELLGKKIWEQVCFRHVVGGREKFLELRRNDSVRSDDLPLEAADGRLIDVEFVSNAYEVSGRKVIQCHIRDITERRRMEESLRLLGSAVEQSREPIMITEAGLDFPGPRIVFVNPAHTVMTGYSAAETLGRTPRMLQGPQTDKTVLSRLRKNLTDGGTFHGEAVNYRKDGTTFDLEWQVAPLRTAEGKITHFVAIQRDITARKAAEIALRESEERFKFVARAVSDAVWDWDLVANTLWWSDGFVATFGFPVEETEPDIGSWAGRIHPDERGRTVAGIHEAINAGAQTWSAEYRFRRKDGGYAFVHDRGYIIRDATGAGIRMVGGMRDLTRQKEIETRYLRAQRMEGIGTLAGGIAHDLNNVLAPILMSIELLKFDSAGDPKRAKILDIIRQSAQRGADLVSQVLSFARGVGGERGDVRINLLFDDLVALIRPTFPRNLRMEIVLPAPVWAVTGDAGQLHQVLLNLAVNARDAMPAGGTLTFSATNLVLDGQYVGAGGQAGPYVCVRVTDTGTGIPPAIRERIFEPFFTTKETGSGTGLGLATAHTVVKSHGGFIEVESEMHQGSAFKIYLPAAPGDRIAAPGPLPPAEPARGRDELVLVIDDEQAIRDITRRTLETYGYRVLTAADGAEAISIYAQQSARIALVVTDMMMPIMDGPATIQSLRHLNPGVRIIAVSGVDAHASAARAAPFGVHAFLRKPFTAEALRSCIREVLDRPTPTA